jgi:hypothetical protein
MSLLIMDATDAGNLRSLDGESMKTLFRRVGDCAWAGHSTCAVQQLPGMDRFSGAPRTRIRRGLCARFFLRPGWFPVVQ